MQESFLDQLIKESYIFTFPLVMEYTTLENCTNTILPTSSKAPINQLIHCKNLANSSTKAVVTPNVDTIYTQAFLNLQSNKAFVFIKPKTNRYCSFQILDGYTNTVALLGSGFDSEEEGHYLITRDNYLEDIPSTLTHIKVNTDIVWIIGRTICNNDEDLINVYEIQSKMDLIPLENYITKEKYIPERGSYDKNKDFVPIEHVLGLSPADYFNLANSLMITNPPKKEDMETINRVSSIGVGPNEKFDISLLGDNPTEKWHSLLSQIDLELQNNISKFYISNNGWSYFGYPIGDFGIEYKFRAEVAKKGLGANPIDAAIYARINKDSENHDLDGTNTYLIHFDKNKLPPTEDYGFWSITAYNEDDFLIDNSLNRYVINDRSNFIYNEDGSLDLYVTSKNDTIPKDNWLPVTNDKFHLFLRIYLPSQEVRDNSYQVPKINQIL